MNSLWSDAEAAPFVADPLQLRAYTSRLLGREPTLVLHGGGNTSIKTKVTNLHGESEPIIYIKGTGWDLATIQPAGFAPCRLAELQRLATLARLSDTDMVRDRKSTRLNSSHIQKSRMPSSA